MNNPNLLRLNLNKSQPIIISDTKFLLKSLSDDPDRIRCILSETYDYESPNNIFDVRNFILTKDAFNKDTLNDNYFNKSIEGKKVYNLTDFRKSLYSLDLNLKFLITNDNLNSIREIMPNASKFKEFIFNDVITNEDGSKTRIGQNHHYSTMITNGLVEVIPAFNEKSVKELYFYSWKYILDVDRNIYIGIMDKNKRIFNMMRHNLELFLTTYNGTAADTINDLKKIIKFYELSLNTIIKNLNVDNFKNPDELVPIYRNLRELNKVNYMKDSLEDINFDKYISKEKIINHVVNVLRNGNIIEFIHILYGDKYDKLLKEINYDNI